MVRSGCVSRRLRAASPTTMLPSESRLTTDGHNVLPYGPGIHFGWLVCGSRYATRLLVVPRSMPTILPMVKPGEASPSPTAPYSRSRQFLLHVYNEVPDVRAAIQQFVQPRHDFLERGVVRIRVDRSVPFACCCLELGIDFR